MLENQFGALGSAIRLLVLESFVKSEKLFWQILIHRMEFYNKSFCNHRFSSVQNRSFSYKNWNFFQKVDCFASMCSTFLQFCLNFFFVLSHRSLLFLLFFSLICSFFRHCFALWNRTMISHPFDLLFLGPTQVEKEKVDLKSFSFQSRHFWYYSKIHKKNCFNTQS